MLFRSRLVERKNELAGLGEIEFSDEEYARVKAEHERLKRAHDEYVRLLGQQEELDRLQHDLDDLRDPETWEKVEPRLCAALQAAAAGRQ